MDFSNPTFECVICNDKGLEVGEFCGNCAEGPLCSNCKEYCEWSHTPAAGLDRENDMKHMEWKERDLI